ncbi:MAG: CHASE2 domain-containing protein, partial [Pseudanabaena sp.]
MRSPFSEFISRLFPKLLTNYQTKRWRSRLVSLVCRALPTIFAIIVIIPMVYLGFLQTIEFCAYNSFTSWRGDRPWDERVIIIAIDDNSLSKIGRFPWTRNLYVQLIQKLELTEASIVGFDILWSESTPADQQLAAAISRYQKVFLAMAWDKSGQPLLPIAPINNVGVAVGHILKREDVDGVVRQVDLQIRNIPTFAVSILQAYDLITASNTLLPDLDQTLTINWTKRVKDIPQVSFSDVIDGKIPASTFRNKIVLVGVTASGIDDLVTPLDRNPPASGVHLHAMVLQNLLQKNSFTVAKSIDIWSIALLGSLFIGLILPRQNLWTGSISGFVLSGLWLV